MDLLRTTAALHALLDDQADTVASLRQTWTPNCYCEEGQSFCGGYCPCGMPAHAQHYPGPFPGTGSWCTRCAIDISVMVDALPFVDPELGIVRQAAIDLYDLVAAERRQREGLPDHTGAPPAKRRTIHQSDAWLDQERAAGRLEGEVALRLDAGLLTDTGMAHLAGLTSLKRLWIESTGVTDAGLVHLSTLTSLEDLHLDTPNVTAAGVATVARLVGLKSLILTCGETGDAELAALSQLRGLQSLDLRRTTVSDAGLAHLSGLRALSSLELHGSEVSGSGLGHLGKIPGLQALGLTGAPLRGEELTHLTAFPALERLDLSDTPLDDADLARLGGLVNLTSLDLSDTAVRGEGLRHLLGLERLGRLGLIGTPVSDEAFQDLTALPSLNFVTLTRWGEIDITGRAWCEEAHVTLSPEAVAAFVQARPACRVSYASPRSIRRPGER